MDKLGDTVSKPAAPEPSEPSEPMPTIPAPLMPDIFALALNCFAPYGNVSGIPISGMDEIGPAAMNGKKYNVIKYAGFEGMTGEFVNGVGPYGLVFSTIEIEQPKVILSQLIHGSKSNGIIKYCNQNHAVNGFNLIKVKGLNKTTKLKLATVYNGDRIQVWEDAIKIYRQNGSIELVRVPVNATRILCLEIAAFLQLCLIERINPARRPLLSQLLALILQYMKAANSIDLIYEDIEYNLMLYDNVTRPLIQMGKVALGRYDDFKKEKPAYVALVDFLIKLNETFTKAELTKDNIDLLIFMKMTIDLSQFFS